MRRTRALAPALSLSLLPLLPGAALAQAPVRHVEGLAGAERLGLAVDSAGDVDGDGIPDLLLGAPYASPSGGFSGRVVIASGADGTLLRNLAGAAPGDLFGCAVAVVGDVDGDGVPDHLIGARGDNAGGQNAGAAFLVSGADGSLIRVHRGRAGDNLGAAVCALGDVNGDGVPDYAVGSWTADANGTNSGAVRVIDGASGALLHLLAGEAPYDHFGGALANAGDVNGDGVADLVVGARWSSHSGFAAGSAYVYSGADGTLIRALRGLVAGDAFGAAVAGAGDVDGDGIPDVAVGAPGAGVGGASSGSATIFSGADGSVLRVAHGHAVGDSFGGALAALDFDQDGVPDLAVGAEASDGMGTASGSVRVISGADGSVLATFHGGMPGDRFGAALAVPGDVDGDGLPDLLVGAYGDAGKGPMTGAGKVVSFAVPGPTTYCPSTPNSSSAGARIGYRGSVSVAANDLRLIVRDAPPAQLGLFYYGTSQVQVPYGDGLRCVGGQVFRLPILATDGAGQLLLALDLGAPPGPAGAIHPGSTWNFQFWFRDPFGPGGGGFNFSDALEASFAP